MNNYNFSMEKILEWRSTIEKDKMEVFGKSHRSLKREQDILSKHILEIEDTNIKSMEEKDIYKLRQYNLYKENLEAKIQSQEKKILEIKIALEAQRLELILAQKDRSVMEKLREKDFHAYKKNVQAVEQKEIDEIAVLRHKEMEAY